MKLNVVPARTGASWVKQGIKTFWRQPLALSGLFFLFTGLLSLTSLLSYAGTFLGLMLLPAITMGMMAAAREADLGRFPMPRILFIAFQQGASHAKRMIWMGFFYAVFFGLVLALSTLFDNGEFARLYLLGGSMGEDVVMNESFQTAVVFFLLMNLPVAALFWHAPALVHWHDQPLAKSIFFSAMACWVNWRAFLMFGLTWLVVFISTTVILSLVSILTDDGQLSMMLILPAMMLLAAMFFASSYHSFRECFSTEPVLA